MKLYAVCQSLQDAEIKQFCFNDCGKIQIGGLEFADMAWWLCREENCPYLEKEESIGEVPFDWGKEEMVLRKLKTFGEAPTVREKQGDRWS